VGEADAPLEERRRAPLQRGRGVADVDGADGGVGAHVAVVAHPRVGARVAEVVLLVAAGELGCVTGEGELEAKSLVPAEFYSLATNGPAVAIL
jgi:hypothetical protein